MNHDPPEITGVFFLILPHNRGDRLFPAADGSTDIFTDVGILTFRAVIGIVKPCDRQSHHHSQPDSVVRYGFLQDDKAPGVLILVRDNTAECNLPAKGIECVLRLEDRSVNAEHFKLFQIATTDVAHSNQRR
jgi:hypothetical protein